MFDELIKELSRLKKQEVSIPINADDNGYIDKQCPSENCEFLFKVHHEDWRNIVKDEAVWCPFCRHEADADQWFTKSQVEHANAETLGMVKGRIHNAMLKDARRFNRRQPRNSFISMSMEVKGGTKRTYFIPAIAAEPMQLEITCEKCTTRFAVVGSAYFCPACGHNSVLRTFSDSLRKIKTKKDNVDIVREAITEAEGKDEGEVTSRSMIESCLLDGVVAFQKYCEGMYEPYGKSRMNTFQNLEQGNKCWKKAIGTGYENWLSINELQSLVILFQKRHLLAHNEGIVDDRYVRESKDNTYKVGQRIVITVSDIDDMVVLIEKLSHGIKRACT